MNAFVRKLEEMGFEPSKLAGVRSTWCRPHALLRQVGLFFRPDGSSSVRLYLTDGRRGRMVNIRGDSPRAMRSIIWYNSPFATFDSEPTP